MYERLEMLLKERGITPYKLSKNTGIATATLSDWKTNKSRPKRDKIEKIAKFLDVDPDWIEGKTDERHAFVKKALDDLTDGIPYEIKEREDGSVNLSLEPSDLSEFNRLAAKMYELTLDPSTKRILAYASKLSEHRLQELADYAGYLAEKDNIKNKEDL